MSIPSTSMANAMVSSPGLTLKRISGSHSSPLRLSTSNFSLLLPKSTQRKLRLAAFTQSSSQSKILSDPAHLTGRGQATVLVEDQLRWSLDAYMTLPASQYYELDPKLIMPLGGNKFKLKVPRVQLFNVWIEPEADIVVKQEAGPNPKVILEAVDCHLFGSPIIQKWQLDKRFTLHFITELTWVSNALKGSSNGNASGVHQGVINADLSLDVYTEVIPPFTLLPRSVLEGTCNAVVAGLINSLLPLFMSKLSQDYVKWASNAEYRARRAAISAKQLK